MFSIVIYEALHYIDNFDCEILRNYVLIGLNYKKFFTLQVVNVMSDIFSEINNHLSCWLRTTQALSLQDFRRFP